MRKNKGEKVKKEKKKSNPADICRGKRSQAKLILCLSLDIAQSQAPL